MNRLILIVVLLVTSSTLNAQGQYKLSIKPYSGYEVNPLKAPGSYTDSNGVSIDRSSLWNSIPYAGLEATFTTVAASQRHALELYSNYRSSFSINDSPVRSAIMEFGLKYSAESKKKTANVIKLRYRDFVKTGEDQDNLLGAPLSYRRLILTDEFTLKMKNNWRLSFVPKSILKMYQRAGYDRFLYINNGLNTQLAYRYNLKNKVGYYLNLGAAQRNHFINRGGDTTLFEDDFEEIDFEEGEGGEPEEFEEESESLNRMWRYYSAQAGIKIPVNEKLKLLFDLGYTLRQDVLDEHLGFGQTSLEFGLQYKYKRWRVALGAAHLGRSYSSLSATGSESLLRYDYLKFKSNIQYTISKSVTAFAQGSSTVRISNSDLESSRALRSYFIGEFAVGVRIVIKGKYGVNK